MRKYSLAEIALMRSAIWDLNVMGCGPYGRDEMNSIVENKLRTYMANGTEPDELHQRAEKRRKAHTRRLANNK